MNRGTAWSVHAAVATSGATGLAYGWMLYFAEPVDDPFSVVGHPWQPFVQHWHVLLSPVLLFLVGLIWRTHVWARIRAARRERRRTGIWLAAWFGPMVLSGYALQTSTDEAWRLGWVWVHGVSSSLWLLGYGVHQLLRARLGSARVTLVQGSAAPGIPGPQVDAQRS